MTDLEEIKDSFDIFDDWEDRYRFIIDLGKSIPALSDAERIEENIVRGCQSQVWLLADYDEPANRLSFRIDSDAHIVRGLIAIVQAAYSKKSPREISQYDVESLFEELNLFSHLSRTRGNGLRAMVQRIRHEADQIGF